MQVASTRMLSQSSAIDNNPSRTQKKSKPLSFKEKKTSRLKQQQQQQQVSRLSLDRQAASSSPVQKRSISVNQKSNQVIEEGDVNYYSYKQTGIKSRPVKLLKHPIEHIERKIIITYIIGFLFKLIAILSGPLIVLFAFLLVLPSILLRRLLWRLLNFKFLFDARIKIKDDENTTLDWCYCPLTYLETFWLKEKLVNNVILVIENTDRAQNEAFSIDKFRELIYYRILERPAYKKFLCRVLPIGIPFYKSYFWQRLELASIISVPQDITSKEGNKNFEEREEDLSSNHSSSSQFSNSQIKDEEEEEEEEEVNFDDNKEIDEILMPEKKLEEKEFKITSKKVSQQKALLKVLESQNNNSQNEFERFKKEESKVYLSNHIYIDNKLTSCLEKAAKTRANSKEFEKAHIRRYVHKLTEVNLDMSRPLWEMRVVPAQVSKRTYLIFRCHQSLADGHSLCRILTDHLTTESNNEATAATDTLASQEVSVVCSSQKNPASSLEKFEGEEEEVVIEAEMLKESSSNAIQDVEVNSLNLGEDKGVDDDCEVEDAVNGREIKVHNQRMLMTTTLEEEGSDRELRAIGEKKSFVSKVSKANSYESSVLVGPLTVLLWVVWTFTRRKNNHLNKSSQASSKSFYSSSFSSLNSDDLVEDQQNSENINIRNSIEKKKNEEEEEKRRKKKKRKNRSVEEKPEENDRRFYMTHYDLTKFHQIKQMTRSTVSEVILCALSGALRDYLRNFNGVSNPPSLNVSLTVDMRQETATSNLARSSSEGARNKCKERPETDDYSDEKRRPREADQSEIMIEEGVKRELDDKVEVNCTLVNVPIPTSVEGCVPRLWELRTTMEELRTSADPWVMLGLKKFLFLLLPISWYQWLINYIALRNSSIFVSNIRGPKNMVESWCVDLFQRALFEAQQPPRSVLELDVDSKMKSTSSVRRSGACSVRSQEKEEQEEQKLHRDKEVMKRKDKERNKRKRKVCGRLEEKEAIGGGGGGGKLRLINEFGCLSAIYYCMQPPTSEIPISFNCITYHNKLFVTSLSRSLLVEDSKLLIKLFFAQLNQLADTIAKRKTFFRIIATPLPIEISCQLPSPVLDKSNTTITTALATSNSNQEIQSLDEHNQDQVEEDKGSKFDHYNKQATNLSQDLEHELEHETRNGRKLQIFNRNFNPIKLFPSSKTTTSRIIKDDLEANLGDTSDTKCAQCRQLVCTCRRRKSLFSSSDSNQRSDNLFSLLHPNYYLNSSSSSKSVQEDDTCIISKQQQECLCGQRLLEELDEEIVINNGESRQITTSKNDSDSGERDLSRDSIRSNTPSDYGGRKKRSFCAKCRYNSARSLNSLNEQQQQQQIQNQTNRQQTKYWFSKHNTTQNRETNDGSNLSISSTHCRHSSAGSHLPSHSSNGKSNCPQVSRFYSKSETDLLPIQDKNRDLGRGSTKRKIDKVANSNMNAGKESWFVIGRRGNRKISTIFPRSPFNSSFKIKKPQGNGPTTSTSPVNHQWRSKNLIETSLELINTHIPSSKRRQSVATTTGASSNIHKSVVVVKDEINEDVNLRYHLDGSILGIRNRRFSTIGSAVVGTTQRRSSLIPFGLMNNQAFPKLLRDDGEAHV